MIEQLTCPNCGASVLDNGNGYTQPQNSARRQRADCPSCGRRLVRNPDEPELTAWREEAPRHPRG